MAALRMAALWESRLVHDTPTNSISQQDDHHHSKDTDTDSDVVDVIPVDTDPFDTRPANRKPESLNPTRTVVSSGKPPVPPPISRNNISQNFEQVSNVENALDSMSPVSSFASSDAGSPRAFPNPMSSNQSNPSPLQNSIRRENNQNHIQSSNILQEIAHLRQVLQDWDERIDKLESMQQRWKKQLGNKQT